MNNQLTIKILFFNLLIGLIACQQKNTTSNIVFENIPFQQAADSAVFKGKQGFETWQKIEKYYASSNKIRESYTTKAGQKAGKYHKYYRNGNLEKQGKFVNNKKEGEWLSYHYIQEKNSKHKAQLSKKEIFVADQRHGLLQEWYADGQKQKEVNYQNDRQEGQGLSWYENGQLQSELHFSDHVPHGSAKVWYENGQAKSFSHFEQGKQIGLAQDWYEDGKQMRELHYENGMRHGPYKIWDEAGVLRMQGRYENNEIVETISQ